MVHERSEDDEVSSQERKSHFFKQKRPYKNSDDEDDFDDQFESDEDLEAQRSRVKCLDGRVGLVFDEIKNRIRRNESIAQIHEQQREEAKNQLKEQNKYMFQKTKILTGGVASHTELLAFTFIKFLSTKASLESTTHKSDFEAEFRDRFYLKLIEIEQNRLFQALEDLAGDKKQVLKGKEG